MNFNSKIGSSLQTMHVKWNLSQALAASNGIRLYVTLACVNKIGLLRSIYTGHYRWSSNQMDFMSRGHHSSGDFCWMIFIFWFRAPPFSFFFISILHHSLQPSKRSSDFWPHESLMSSMIHHPSDCFLAFWIGKVRFLYFFSTKIIP